MLRKDVVLQFQESYGFGLRELAVNRHAMLVIGNAIVAVLVIAYMMFGAGASVIR